MKTPYSYSVLDQCTTIEDVSQVINTRIRGFEEENVKALTEVWLIGYGGIVMNLIKLGYTLHPSRSTADIDAKYFAGDMQSYLALEAAGVDSVRTFDSPPAEDFEENWSYQIGNLKVKVPKLEYLAAMKLISRRPKDLKDLASLPILENCDMVRLTELVEDCLSYEFHISPDIAWTQIEELKKERGII